jgi:hypothetical protein
LRRLAIPAALAAMLVPFLASSVSATTLDEPPLAEVQEIGPGQYSSHTKTFPITELDVSEGLIIVRPA